MARSYEVHHRSELGLSPPDRPRRLLLVVDSLDVGGAERHAVGLGAAFARAGYAVTVACSVTGVLALSAEQVGLTVSPLLNRRVKRRLSLPYAWKLARLVRQGHFDLVHAHIYASAAASALATVG
ncbi:MAG: glycosyltransferase family 4 protein, partial [Pseudomonadota bacterium]|nr:glycosyltransferase family 4 protein [Pseudomonadota bacterium]